MERISGEIGVKQLAKGFGKWKLFILPDYLSVNTYINPGTTEYPATDDRRPEWNRFARDSLFRTGLVSWKLKTRYARVNKLINTIEPIWCRAHRHDCTVYWWGDTNLISFFPWSVVAPMEKVYLSFVEVSTSWSGVLRLGFTGIDPAFLNPGEYHYSASLRWFWCSAQRRCKEWAVSDKRRILGILGIGKWRGERRAITRKKSSEMYLICIVRF